jgi:hypothetical protein
MSNPEFFNFEILRETGDYANLLYGFLTAELAGQTMKGRSTNLEMC